MDEYFWRENLCVKIFNKKELKNQNIIDDFFGQINVDFEVLEKVEFQNESINNIGLHLLLEINKNLSQFNPLRKKIANLIRDKYTGATSIYTRKEMKDFFEEFEDINIKTKNKFFTNSERLFENNFNQYPLEKIRYPDKKELFNELVNLFDRVL